MTSARPQKCPNSKSFPSKLIAVLYGCLVMTAAQAGVVTKLDDHSLPRSKVKTYHFTCSNSRFGMVRVDSTVTPNTICASVQDGSKPESCNVIRAGEADVAIGAAANLACQ